MVYKEVVISSLLTSYDFITTFSLKRSPLRAISIRPQPPPMVNGDNGLRHYLFANISLRGISFPCLKLYRVAQKTDTLGYSCP